MVRRIYIWCAKDITDTQAKEKYEAQDGGTAHDIQLPKNSNKIIKCYVSFKMLQVILTKLIKFLDLQGQENLNIIHKVEKTKTET